MAAELLDWANNYLAQDEEIVVSIKKMWNEWRLSHAEPALDVFTALLMADERFEDMGGIDHTEGMEWMTPEEMAEYIQDMEAVGFYSGPRLKLKSRELTLEHIARMIKKHNDRMEGALRHARAAMPDNVDEQEESQLIEIIALAEQLRQHLREAGLEPDDEAPA